MGKLVFDRIAYKNGIMKPENQVIEFHAFCDCDRCNYRKNYIKNGLRNQLTVTIKDKNRLIEAKEFIHNWKCRKKDHTFETEYVTF